MGKSFEWIKQMPYWDEVEAAYDLSKERIQEAGCRLGQRLRRLK